MLLHLFVFLLTAACWVGFLWLAVAPNFSAWIPVAIGAAHLAPPLLGWSVWYLLRRRALRRKNEEASIQAAQAEAERETARQAARKKYDEELRQKRFACDCRIVAIAGLHSSAPILQEDIPNVDIQTRELDDPVTASGTALLDRLSPALSTVLETIYTTSSAAAAFPIFLAPPAELSGEEVVSRIRAIHAAVCRQLELPVAQRLAPPVLFLPVRDSSCSRMLALFETEPELPAAVILAFDSPLARALPEDEAFEDTLPPECTLREKHFGKPNEGVTALLVTNTELPSMLTAITNLPDAFDQHDSQTPFWEKLVQPGGYLGLLARIPPQERLELGQLPVLGRIHRAAYKDVDHGRAGVLELTKLMQTLLEGAQVNAGLLDAPFTHQDDETVVDAKDAEAMPPPRCERLVHNAGGVDFAGKRLAALGSALFYFGIDLNPVDPAVAANVVTRLGDLGGASAAAQIAVSIAHAAESRSPVLCTEFGGDKGIAVSVVMPGVAIA